MKKQQEDVVFIKRLTGICLGINILVPTVIASISGKDYIIAAIGCVAAILVSSRVFSRVSRDIVLKDFSVSGALIDAVVSVVLSLIIALLAYMNVSLIAAISVLVPIPFEIAVGLLYINRYNLKKK